MDRTPRHIVAGHVIGMIAVALCVLAWQTGLLTMAPASALPAYLRVLIGACALAVVALDAVFLVTRFYSNRDTHVQVKLQDGAVAISVGAIEESLARTARTLPEVNDARIRVYKEKGEGRPVSIVVHLAVWEETNVADVTRKLKQACMTRFEQIAGAEVRPEFSILLSRIDVKPARKPARGKGGEAEEEPIDLFRGPQYPTTGEF
jgi:hypothetical protein